MNEMQVKKSAEYRKQYQEGELNPIAFMCALHTLHLTDEEYTQAISFTRAEEWCREARKEAKK